MVIEYWLLGILVAAGVLVIGFLAGRLTAPGERHTEALREERDAARQELGAMRERVNDHFGESARLFGNLANDYRALYEHFAHSAQDLGLPETDRREMLESAAGPLPETREPERPVGPAADTAGEPAMPPQAASESEQPRGDDNPAAR